MTLHVVDVVDVSAPVLNSDLNPGSDLAAEGVVDVLVLAPLELGIAAVGDVGGQQTTRRTREGTHSCCPSSWSYQ